MKGRKRVGMNKGPKKGTCYGKGRKRANMKHATAGKTTSDLGRETNQKLHGNSERKCLFIIQQKKLIFPFHQKNNSALNLTS